MNDAMSFLTVMGALSTSAQTLTEHLVKKRWAHLDEPKVGAAEGWRQTLVHVICGTFGGSLAYGAGLHPLTESLGAKLAWAGQGSGFTEYLFVGVLVSYGGSFFDETLGLLREFKKAQQDLQNPPAQMPVS